MPPVIAAIPSIIGGIGALGSAGLGAAQAGAGTLGNLLMGTGATSLAAPGTYGLGSTGLTSSLGSAAGGLSALPAGAGTIGGIGAASAGTPGLVGLGASALKGIGDAGVALERNALTPYKDFMSKPSNQFLMTQGKGVLDSMTPKQPATLAQPTPNINKLGELLASPTVNSRKKKLEYGNEYQQGFGKNYIGGGGGYYG